MKYVLLLLMLAAGCASPKPRQPVQVRYHWRAETIEDIVAEAFGNATDEELGQFLHGLINHPDVIIQKPE